jgi:hypothetical protein
VTKEVNIGEIRPKRRTIWRYILTAEDVEPRIITLGNRHKRPGRCCGKDFDLNPGDAGSEYRFNSGYHY